nr:MAG TPA: hypothetical protein [Caudoviricetes sp.]
MTVYYKKEDKSISTEKKIKTLIEEYCIYL